MNLKVESHTFNNVKTCKLKLVTYFYNFVKEIFLCSWIVCWNIS